MDEFIAAITPYLPIIKAVALAIGILIAGWIVAKWSERLVVRVVERRQLDKAIGRFVGSLLRYTVLTATVIATLGAVGVETTSLVAVFASAGLAVGLALQGMLGNFASGVLILFFRPFNLKDKITASGQMGVVEDIGIFATTMLTVDNEVIIIPNGQVTGGSIINHTRKGIIRGAVDVGVAYGADVGKVLPVLLAAAKKAELVAEEPEPAVAFVGLGASSLDFKVFAWATPENYIPMHHHVRRAIYEELNAAGIEIPFAQIVVHQAAE